MNKWLKRFASCFISTALAAASQTNAAFKAGDLFAKSSSGEIRNITAGGDFSESAPLTSVGNIADAGRPAFSADYSTMFVSSADEGRVYAVGSDGSKAVYASGLTSPQGLLRTKSGKLLVAQSGSVIDITGGGDCTNTLPFAANLANPVDLAETTSGRIFVCDIGANHIYDITSGGPVDFDSPYAFVWRPSSIIANPAGGIVAVSNDLAQVYSIGGPSADSIEMAHGLVIQGIAYAQDGRLLATTACEGRVVDISAGGDIAKAPTFAVGAGAFAIALVPEPATLVSIAAALAL